MKKKLIVALLVCSSLIVCWGLDSLGTPSEIALVLAFVLVALAALPIELRLTRKPGQPLIETLPFYSISIGSLGCLFGVAGVGSKYGGPAAILTLALEIAVVVSAIKIWRRGARRLAVVQRQRLASLRGWTFEPSAKIPVPGPFTAVRLQSVPNNASRTTGKNVVWAQMRGLTVAVFDRVRKGDKNPWPQTVWLIRDARLDRAGSARMEWETILADGQKLRWWLEGDCMCAVMNRGAQSAANADLIEEGASFLAKAAIHLVSRTG